MSGAPFLAASARQWVLLILVAIAFLVAFLLLLPRRSGPRRSQQPPPLWHFFVPFFRRSLFHWYRIIRPYRIQKELADDRFEDRLMDEVRRNVADIRSEGAVGSFPVGYYLTGLAADEETFSTAGVVGLPAGFGVGGAGGVAPAALAAGGCCARLARRLEAEHPLDRRGRPQARRIIRVRD